MRKDHVPLLEKRQPNERDLELATTFAEKLAANDN
jgi:hypothetical protein